jgi:hypothetical protein
MPYPSRRRIDATEEDEMLSEKDAETVRQAKEAAEDRDTFEGDATRLRALVAIVRR